MAGLLGGVVLLVGASEGFPSTHWVVHGFYRDTLGLSEDAANQASAITRKAFHVPAYALLGFLVFLALPSRWQRVGVAMGIVIVVAIADELLQSYQPNRGASVWDVALDAVGGLLGVWLALALLASRRARAR